jgi:ComF family protein
MIREMKGLSNRLPGSWRPTLIRCVARLWPQDCFVCGARAGETAVCAACEGSLPRHTAAHCPACALPTPDAQRCGQCLRRAPHFDSTLAVFSFEHPVREMVLALKFGAVFAIRGVLVRGLVAVAQEADAIGELQVDCIVPMPLHRERIAERGFNQAMELARDVGRALGVPVRPHLVQRDSNTQHQAGLPLQQRRKNLRGAFRCVEPLAGLRVLVIDDVMTSGATLDELARTLKLAGAAHVTNLLVARTLRSK